MVKKIINLIFIAWVAFYGSEWAFRGVVLLMLLALSYDNEK